MYATADGRFIVRNDAGRWYLVDTAHTDDLGQELIRGPFPTKDAAHTAIPEARRADIKPPKPTAPSTSKPTRPPKPKSKPKPPSWIDRLSPAEASRVRAQVRALEREGIDDAEALVRHDREGIAPAIAQRLIESRLAELTAGLAGKERAAVESLVRRVAAIVAGSSGKRPAALPGWTLVETGPQPDPANRRIILPD